MSSPADVVIDRAVFQAEFSQVMAGTEQLFQGFSRTRRHRHVQVLHSTHSKTWVDKKSRIYGTSDLSK